MDMSDMCHIYIRKEEGMTSDSPDLSYLTSHISDDAIPYTPNSIQPTYPNTQIGAVLHNSAAQAHRFSPILQFLQLT